jgi:hypothetical protein
MFYYELYHTVRTTKSDRRKTALIYIVNINIYGRKQLKSLDSTKTEFDSRQN